jgi:endonuclease YncB( thermonuclease family)
MGAQIGDAVMQCFFGDGRLISPMVVAGGVIRNRKEVRQSVNDAYLRAETALLEKKTSLESAALMG